MEEGKETKMPISCASQFPAIMDESAALLFPRTIHNIPCATFSTFANLR